MFGNAMKRFYLNRMVDMSGISSTGCVAGGVCFDDGKCVVRWNTEVRSIEVWDSPQDMMSVHGHGGATMLIWMDK